LTDEQAEADHLEAWRLTQRIVRVFAKHRTRPPVAAQALLMAMAAALSEAPDDILEGILAGISNELSALVAKVKVELADLRHG